MNTMTEISKKAAFKLRRDDLERPNVLLKAYRELLGEVWRYATPWESGYARELPFDYVVNRFHQQLPTDLKYEEIEVEIAAAIFKLVEEGYLEFGRYSQYLVLP